MKLIPLSAFLFCISAFSALAHSAVDTTSPANEAVLTRAPEEVRLSFANRIRLTRVQMSMDGNAAVDLDLGDQKSFGTEFVIPVSINESGQYEVEWRGLGIDGHAMQGSFIFTVE